MDGHGRKVVSPAMYFQIIQRWLDTLQPPPLSLCIAYSGGRDSHTLLHALWRLRPNITLRAIHIDHGIHPNSASWAAHCRKIAQTYDIPIDIFSLKLICLSGESLEERARRERYRLFAEQLKEHEILLTAHTLNDQAETFLLQLCRGSGLSGLASIAAQRPLGKGSLARPLLNVNRSLINAYAEAYHLEWIEDPSNEALHFRRNFLRHRLLPLLEEVYPGVIPCIARSAIHCAEGQALLDTFLSAELEKGQGDLPHTLQVDYLRSLSLFKQKHVLRYWLQKNGVVLPSAKKLQTILDQVLTAKPDAQPDIHWGAYCIKRARDLLYVLPSASFTPLVYSHLSWDLNVPLCLSDGTIWAAKRVSGRGISEEKLKEGIEVRFRQGGERCRPVGRGSRPLKKWLQDYKVPAWLRYHLPLLYHGESLVGVGDLFVCEGWQVLDPGLHGWVIEKVN